jgi:hypothetical protein
MAPNWLIPSPKSPSPQAKSSKSAKKPSSASSFKLVPQALPPPTPQLDFSKVFRYGLPMQFVHADQKIGPLLAIAATRFPLLR